MYPNVLIDVACPSSRSVVADFNPKYSARHFLSESEVITPFPLFVAEPTAVHLSVNLKVHEEVRCVS